MSRLPRRDFLKFTGLSAAMLALPDPLLGGWFDDSVSPQFHPQQLANTHDLPSLPLWGPFSKKYFGISHIPDVSRGLSFDFSVFPMPTSGLAKLPSVLDASGVHPWEASPGVNFYSLRLEMLWKDQLYCDLSFLRRDERSRLIRMELVNRTDAPQEMTLNCLMQLVFPPLKELTAEPIRLCSVELPSNAVWVHALDYEDLHFATPRPTDNLVPDGKYRGEERCHESVGGSVVAQGFGKEAGDTLIYRVRLKKSFSNAVMVWRFQMGAGKRVVFKVGRRTPCAPLSNSRSPGARGATRPTDEVRFMGDGKFSTAVISLGKLEAGEREMIFTSLGGAPIALNGFALVESGNADDVHFIARPWRPVPEIKSAANGLILSYQDVPNHYGFALSRPLAGHRELKWRDLDTAFGTEPGPNIKARIFGGARRARAGDPDSLFIHAFTRPFTLAPESRQVIYGLVCEGSETQVQRKLNGFNPQSASLERAYCSARDTVVQPAATPSGKKFQFSQQLMAAATLSNLVYPLYTQRQYIRACSPGRIWDCLYTWDAGFTGLGLLELDLPLAVEILNAYTTPPAAQSAFIHHGTPLPVQIYLFYELWNRTQSLDLLKYFYPRLRQYHLFLAGRLGSSTTRRHRDHLICTWDYFYNSGGWDDYPAQKYVHAKKLEPKATPVINSAHTIRCAKLLRQMAAALGRAGDFAEYDEDIVGLSASLQKYSWDETSGYFGYVLHDEQGDPTGILRDESGVNFNMGLDGVYPVIAGICSPEQEQKILENLFSQKHLWMDIGITTVDQSAPYYSPTGYWNGSVWLAHQWFLWKTMLDLGRGDLAYRIARTGLTLWEQATGSTYDCWEHFKPQKPFGQGWDQFTSLSSPALSWFASLYTPGRLTCGFEVWIEECRFHRNNRRLRAKLKGSGKPGRRFSLLACMNPGLRYEVKWNREMAAFNALHDGLLEIHLPQESGTGVLEIASV